MSATAETIFGVINGTHQFHEYPLHSITVNGAIWFRAKDVTQILGYKNTVKALANNVQGKHTAVLAGLLQTVAGAPPSEYTYNELQSKYVNEPGIYALIFRSRLPLAQEFQQYVWEEILPAMRREAYARSMVQIERLQIESREKEKRIVALERRELALSSYVHNTAEIPKAQVLYIATTQAYAAQNRFKFGGVRELHDLRKRLLEYNVGRPEGDLYYYAQVYQCTSYKSVEERLHILLVHFKDKEDSRKEMVRMCFPRLQEAVKFVISNFNGEVDWMNQRCEVILRETVYENAVIVPPLDLNEYHSTAAATVRINVSGWSDEEFASLFEELVDECAEEQSVDYKCTQDGPAQLEMPWSAISGYVKKETRGMTLMQWRDKFRRWHGARQLARLQVRGLKLG